MKKIALSIMIVFLSTQLLGCGSMYNAGWSYDNWQKKTFQFNKYSDYQSPTSEENKVKVVFITNGLDGYDIYDYRDSSDKPAVKYVAKENTTAYSFPSKKIDFGFAIPDDFKGKTVYSFYMRHEPHIIRFEGMAAAIISPGKTCSIDYKFNPELNKNYVFYFHKSQLDSGKEICQVDVKEVL
jgi:hypothetical protein